MGTLDAAVERRLAGLDLPLAVALPGGRRFGPARAAVTLRLERLSSLVHLATGQVGRVGEDYVEGRLDIDGALRDIVAIAAQMIGEDPTQVDARAAPLVWWRELMRTVRSRRRHLPQADAHQVQFHYDVSDDFYALWLDPRRVYSCAYYRDAGMALAQAQEASQQLMRNLRPPVLDAGIVPALDWLLLQFRRRTGCAASFRTNTDQIELDDAAAMTVYRTLQEALTNISKHAQAGRVDVDLVVRDGQLSLEILDDGRGIAPGDLDKPTSYGLRGLSERARAVGGWLEVSPGRNGTAMLLTVPVRATEGGTPQGAAA